MVPATRNPHSATANRCNVRYGTAHPERVNSSSTFTIDRPSFTHPRICSRRPASRAQDGPWPSGRTGRTASTTAPTSPSSTASRPAPRDKPAACAASTYRRALLRSTPARSATLRSPAPSDQPRNTSRTSTTETPLNATAADLHADTTRTSNERTKDSPGRHAG